MGPIPAFDPPNFEVVPYIRWLPYTSSPTDHSALIILTFDMCNLCDRRRYEGDNNNNKYKNNNNNNNKNNKQNIFHERNNMTCSTNCKYRRAASLYFRNMVCFRYIIVNTLHNGETRMMMMIIIIIITIIYLQTKVHWKRCALYITAAFLFR